MKDFENCLLAALPAAHGAPPCSALYLAAVSGGADSTAMLTALARLRSAEPLTAARAAANFSLFCVHVNHGIRPPEEGAGDAQSVRALCAALNVPCRVVSFPPGKIAAFARKRGTGIEAAARVFRSRALHREAWRIGADYILTAHTRDDVLETLLMRVLRGSGPAGLAPMPPIRGRLLRPLLGASRQDVVAYLAERGISYRTDSTNADVRFLRNRIRLKLVPVLNEFFPSWRTSLAVLAETQALAAGFLAAETEKRLPWASSPGKLSLAAADFFAAPPLLREEAVFAGADALAASAPKAALTRNAAFCGSCAPVPKRAAVRRAVADLAAEQTTASDLGPVRLCRCGDTIELKPAHRADRTRGERGFSLIIREAGTYTLEGKVFGLNKQTVRIRAEDAQSVQSTQSIRESSGAAFFAARPLLLRNHRAADCIGKGGHKRRLSDILSKSARVECTGIITAEDTEGLAAFICCKSGGEILVIPRESAARAAENSSLFEVFGGVHAE